MARLMVTPQDVSELFRRGGAIERIRADKPVLANPLDVADRVISSPAINAGVSLLERGYYGLRGNPQQEQQRAELEAQKQRAAAENLDAQGRKRLEEAGPTEQERMQPWTPPQAGTERHKEAVAAHAALDHLAGRDHPVVLDEGARQRMRDAVETHAPVIDSVPPEQHDQTVAMLRDALKITPAQAKALNMDEIPGAAEAHPAAKQAVQTLWSAAAAKPLPPEAAHVMQAARNAAIDHQTERVAAGNDVGDTREYQVADLLRAKMGLPPLAQQYGDDTEKKDAAIRVMRKEHPELFPVKERSFWDLQHMHEQAIAQQAERSGVSADRIREMDAKRVAKGHAPIGLESLDAQERQTYEQQILADNAPEPTEAAATPAPAAEPAPEMGPEQIKYQAMLKGYHAKEDDNGGWSFEPAAGDVGQLMVKAAAARTPEDRQRVMEEFDNTFVPHESLAELLTGAHRARAAAGIAGAMRQAHAGKSEKELQILRDRVTNEANRVDQERRRIEHGGSQFKVKTQTEKDKEAGRNTRQATEIEADTAKSKKAQAATDARADKRNTTTIEEAKILSGYKDKELAEKVREFNATIKIKQKMAAAALARARREPKGPDRTKHLTEAMRLLGEVYRTGSDSLSKRDEQRAAAQAKADAYKASLDEATAGLDASYPAATRKEKDMASITGKDSAADKRRAEEMKRIAKLRTDYNLAKTAADIPDDEAHNKRRAITEAAGKQMEQLMQELSAPTEEAPRTTSPAKKGHKNVPKAKAAPKTDDAAAVLE